MSNRLYSN